MSRQLVDLSPGRLDIASATGRRVRLQLAVTTDAARTVPADLTGYTLAATLGGGLVTFSWDTSLLAAGVATLYANASAMTLPVGSYEWGAFISHPSNPCYELGGSWQITKKAVT